MPIAPAAFWLVLSFLFGAIIGSFLNVVIWRLPRGENLSHPGSHCPKCNHAISALENIPLVSYMLLGGRCKQCRVQISPRYLGVEFLTALVFVILTAHFGPSVEAVVYCLFSAALIAAFFIDFALFIIPDELNTFALLCGFAFNVYLIAQNPSGSLLWGWLPHSISGAMVCAGVFIAIQILGFALFKKYAMGDGDVKLARAIGALLPLRLALVSFLLAIGIGAAIGILKIVWDRVHDGPPQSDNRMDEAENAIVEEDEFGLKETLLFGGAYLLFIDLVVQFIEFVKRTLHGTPKPKPVDDDFEATPSHIPFGPFMVVGFFASIFVGDLLIDGYMRWSHLK